MNILSGFLSGLVHKTPGFTFIHPNIWGGDTPETEKNSETAVFCSKNLEVRYMVGSKNGGFPQQP